MYPESIAPPLKLSSPPQERHQSQKIPAIELRAASF
jgi:hypothetical protein